MSEVDQFRKAAVTAKVNEAMQYENTVLGNQPVYNARGIKPKTEVSQSPRDRALIQYIYKGGRNPQTIWNFRNADPMDSDPVSSTKIYGGATNPSLVGITDTKSEMEYFEITKREMLRKFLFDHSPWSDNWVLNVDYHWNGLEWVEGKAKADISDIEIDPNDNRPEWLQHALSSFEEDFFEKYNRTVDEVKAEIRKDNAWLKEYMAGYMENDFDRATVMPYDQWKGEPLVDKTEDLEPISHEDMLKRLEDLFGDNTGLGLYAAKREDYPYIRYDPKDPTLKFPTYDEMYNDFKDIFAGVVTKFWNLPDTEYPKVGLPSLGRDLSFIKDILGRWAVSEASSKFAFNQYQNPADYVYLPSGYFKDKSDDGSWRYQYGADTWFGNEPIRDMRVQFYPDFNAQLALNRTMWNLENLGFNSANNSGKYRYSKTWRSGYFKSKYGNYYIQAIR